jgi:hypothetical protein
MAGAGAQSGCLDDKETLARIKALAAAGIDTFVIGIPGSESYATSLDTFAQGGGRVNPGAPPSYYAVHGSGSGLDGLTGVLSAITSSVIKTCRLQLASVPPVIDQLNVQIDGKYVPIADTIRGYRDTYGVSYLIVQDKHAEAFSKVMAELR